MLLGERIALVKTGTKDADNACVVGYATVNQFVDLTKYGGRRDWIHLTKLDHDSRYWGNDLGIVLSNVRKCKPKKVKVLPSRIYTVEC